MSIYCLNLFIPFTFQSPSFFFRNLYHGTMFWRDAALHLHAVIGKLTQVGEMLQVSTLVEAEGVRIVAVDVVHEDICSIADALPYVGGFVTASLGADTLWIDGVWPRDMVGDGTADAGTALV